MKYLKTFVLILFATSALQAQDIHANEVPQHIINQYSKDYPNATDIEWERKGKDYKVEFDVGKMEHEIWFSQEGKMVKIEKELTQADLPSNILNFIKREYSTYKIDDVESTTVNGITTYEVELEKAREDDLKIIFNETGEMINIKKD